MLFKTRPFIISFALLFFFIFLVPVTAQSDITDLNTGKITCEHYDSPSGEGIANVIDNNSGTKYLTFHSNGWIQFYIANPYVVNSYTLTSANDSPERDPATWTLAASNNSSGWVTLDSRSNESFTDRYQTKTYSFSNTVAYKYYKIILTCKSGSTLQLAEWELFTAALDHDVSVSAIYTQIREMNTPITPQVIVRNNGLNAESFPVTCKISTENSDVYTNTQNINNLASGSSATVSFESWTPTEDVLYKVKVWTGLATDQLTGNDTMTATRNTRKKAYIIGYSHLDLQWNWHLGTTISEYLPNTLKGNFALFEKYPDYRFNFEGAYRYMLIKQYYPADYAKLKDYIAQGKWYIAGSMVEAVDVIVPSPEALIRQILYGNRFFQKEFGKQSADILLPDCFGFSYALPTIAVHCGLKGFSTQKFDRWGGSFETPFSIGNWEGVDGSKLVSSLKPGAYDNDPDVRESDINELGESSGLFYGYDYYGKIGDIGGPPTEAQVEKMMNLLSQNNTSEIQVVTPSSDQMFKDITSEQAANLPSYKGELLMTTHGTGCYTSHAELKLLNRKNELTASSAERASVAAELFAGKTYPTAQFEESWIKFLAHAFHDDLTGTSIQSAYDRYSIPDYEEALSEFTQIQSDANNSVASQLDTHVDDSNDVPVVVYNPAGFSRYDIAEATVQFPGSVPSAIRVFNKDGEEVPSQIKEISGQSITILFMANIPSVGYAVYYVKKSSSPTEISTGLKATTELLENERYAVTIDDWGDVASVYDKQLEKELLYSSSKLEVRDNNSTSFPAWEVMYDDVVAPVRSYVEQSVEKTVVDSGAARVTIKVTRTNEGSSFTHYYSLNSQADGYLEVKNEVNWKPTHASGSLLKVSFPVTASNSKTTYDLGLGTIDRGINTRNLYEVPGQQWAGITNTDNSYGVAILNDCKYGWDKPANDIIQLTLIHSPKSGGNYTYQGDKFVHNFTYAIYGHAGTWADGNVVSAAERLNQPLIAFQVTPHEGKLGKAFSLVKGDPSTIAIMAVKKSEEGDSYIVRVREAAGKTWNNTKLTFGSNIISAEETNGMEEYKAGVNYSTNKIEFSIGPYQPKTFSVKLDNKLTTYVKDEVNMDSETLTVFSPYPNPSNSSVVISFNLPTEEIVNIKIYNELGQEIRTLLSDSKLSAGIQRINWDHTNSKNEIVSSGIYFIRIETPQKFTVQKISILK